MLGGMGMRTWGQDFKRKSHKLVLNFMNLNFVCPYHAAKQATSRLFHVTKSPFSYKKKYILEDSVWEKKKKKKIAK